MMWVSRSTHHLNPFCCVKFTLWKANLNHKSTWVDHKDRLRMIPCSVSTFAQSSQIHTICPKYVLRLPWSTSLSLWMVLRIKCSETSWRLKNPKLKKRKTRASSPSRPTKRR
eukprot:PhF_6_TR15899/c0_g1_i1/m.24488